MITAGNLNREETGTIQIPKGYLEMTDSTTSQNKQKSKQ